MAVVASAEGKWHESCSVKQKLRDWCMRRLQLYHVASDSLFSAGREFCLLGFVAVTSFRFVVPPQPAFEDGSMWEQEFERIYRKALYNFRDKPPTGFACMDVLGAAWFAQPVPLPMDMCNEPLASFAAKFCGMVGSMDIDYRGDGRFDGFLPEPHLSETHSCTVHALLERWCTDFTIERHALRPSLHHVDSLFGYLLVRGLIAFEMSKVGNRGTMRYATRPGYPSLDECLSYLQSLQKASADDASRKKLVLKQRLWAGASRLSKYPDRCEYDPHFMVRCLRVSRRLKDHRYLKEVILSSAALASMNPAVASPLADPDALKVPSRFQLSRAKPRFDITMMLMRREWNRDKRVRRQLIPDASPQQGLEIFGTREIAIVEGDIKSSTQRLLPLATLSVGHYRQEDKSMAIIHQIALGNGY